MMTEIIVSGILTLCILAFQTLQAAGAWRGLTQAFTQNPSMSAIAINANYLAELHVIARP